MGQCPHGICENRAGKVDEPEQTIQEVVLRDAHALSDEDSPRSDGGGADDPEFQARRIAFLQRKQAKQAKAKKKGGKAYLSNLPETEHDVQYRFNFVVVGDEDMGLRIILSVCGCKEALALAEVDSSFMRLDPAGNHRCLCYVDDPSAGALRRKQAKLIFAPKTIDDDMPLCLTRNDALNTVFAFLVSLDRGAPDPEAHLQEQLTNYERIVAEMRKRSHSKLRPVRAIVLCYKSSGEHGDDDDWWTEHIRMLEQRHGELWKFGPLVAENVDALHAVFAEIASVRITQNQRAVPNEQDEPALAAAKEEDILQTFSRPAADSEANPLVRSVSQCSTSTSGGFQPPTWDTERSGDECGSEDLRDHLRLFDDVPKP